MIDISIAGGDLSLAASLFGDASGPPLLFLHGIGNARDTWFDWAMGLAPRHRVLTLDFRGHGHSARAARYHLADYVRDAEAALAWLGEPTRVVGHSLGGTVAGRLAQRGHPLVQAALLVDPAWFFGVPDEFARSVYPRRFALLQGTIARLRAADAPHAVWVETVGQSPHPWGGVFADHTPSRLIAAHASALQRQDVACWQTPVSDAFGGFDPLEPFRCPTTVIHADDRYGAALLADQAARVAAVNPGASMHFYEGSDHFPHRSHRFAERFGDDLSRWAAAL
ncbi:MAG: alpha/beta hydrolase [Gemmatimonadaceae bacterium]|nr:alpha/beta hydrolase [Gemmatimonadaceae bacterium]